MTAFSVDHDTAASAFLGALDAFVTAVELLDDHDLLTAGRCHGWTALEVVVHVRTGLQEMLAGTAAVVEATPSRDAATYWRGPAPGASSADAVDGILWTRRTASAYRRPTGALEHLRIVADGLRAAVRAMADGVVAFQGHTMRTGDFLATWAVELAVHHVDLGPRLEVPAPTPASLRLVRGTVEALTGPLPAQWDDLTVLLLGTGRVDLDPGQRAAASPAAARLPALG